MTDAFAMVIPECRNALAQFSFEVLRAKKRARHACARLTDEEIVTAAACAFRHKHSCLPEILHNFIVQDFIDYHVDRRGSQIQITARQVRRAWKMHTLWSRRITRRANNTACVVEVSRAAALTADTTEVSSEERCARRALALVHKYRMREDLHASYAA